MASDYDAEAEAWRAVPSLESSYEVSSHGRARALARTGMVRHANGGMHVRKYPAKNLVPSVSSSGYLTLYLGGKDGASGRTRLVHRLVMLAFVGPLPKGMETRHVDGDRHNNHLRNLAYGTQDENRADTMRHGMTTFGEKNPNARLSEGDVLEIRRRAGAGEALRPIGEDFGISEGHASNVATRRAWAHVATEPAQDGEG